MIEDRPEQKNTTDFHMRCGVCGHEWDGSVSECPGANHPAVPQTTDGCRIPEGHRYENGRCVWCDAEQNNTSDKNTTDTPIPTDLSDEGVIEHLKECRRNQAETTRWLWRALEVIRDMPCQEQDNMISASMRAVAVTAVGVSDDE